jgi:hypothetical protein
MCRIRRHGVVDTVTVDCTRHTTYSMLTLCRVSTKICREPQAVAICVQILPPRAFFIGYRKLQCSLRAPLRCIRPSPEVSIALSLGGFIFFFLGRVGSATDLSEMAAITCALFCSSRSFFLIRSRSPRNLACSQPRSLVVISTLPYFPIRWN